MKGFLGLSGVVLIQVYDALFEGHMRIFIMMLALLPTFISFLLMCLVRVNERDTQGNKKQLNRFSTIALLVAAYLMIVIILEEHLGIEFQAFTTSGTEQLALVNLISLI